MREVPPGLAPLFELTNYETVVQLDYTKSKMDLDRMRALLAELGEPHAARPAVHIAGTKGKGSTAHYVAGILSAAGVRAGLFTSPHLERIEERFQVGGIEITTDALIQHVQRLVPYLQATKAKPTFFEIITAIAWAWFRDEAVAVPVMEVGLGGRLDSTNVIEPAVCIITNIGFDHTRQLGDRLDQIASEKAGIIKSGVPVVTAAQEGAGLEVIRRRAAELEAPLVEVCEPLLLDHRLKPLASPGAHQRLNAACAVEAVRILNRQGVTQVTDAQIRSGLEATRLPGRIETVATAPAIVLDAAHNGSSARALATALAEAFSYDKLILIFAILQDKPIDAVLDALVPLCDTVILTRCGSPRSAEPEELATRIAERFRKARVLLARDPSAALAHARRTAAPGDLICSAGSTYLAGELRSLIRSS